MSENRFHSKEAKDRFRKGLESRIDNLLSNILLLQLQLDDSRNWFARFGIRRNLRDRLAQLKLYQRRYETYLKQGLI